MRLGGTRACLAQMDLLTRRPTLGGGGGGRDDVAQGGGADATAIDRALDAIAAELRGA